MQLTYPDIVRRLYDLERLAEPPEAEERGGCMSSYDRRSRYDPDTDTYIDWDANDDGRGIIREEGEWVVAFEQEGPGVIWRTWSAMPDMGRIQVFIDDRDNEKPVIDMPFRDFFDRFQGMPLNFPSIAPTLSRGRNCFIPIPYNKYAQIRLGPGWGAYYHFTYTKFPKDTKVPRFDGNFDREACLALAAADRELGQRGWSALPRSKDDTLETLTVTIPPGKTHAVREIIGNRAITGMRVVPLDLPESHQETAQILRELVFQIIWDNDKTPSVWAPLGDFFGSVPGIQTYRSLTQGSTDGGGFYSHWFMPFSDRALLKITNDGKKEAKLFLTICHRPLEKSAKDMLRFHAKWHRDAFLERPISQGRDIDWPLLILDDGPGRFCGVQMHVWNHWQEPKVPAKDWWYGVGGEKSIDWWWGEGDEKFFVDGEKFPSTFGTGSEDYVGYAWAAEPPFPTFDSAYACQPYVELDANGHTSVCRFHVCDDVPFHKSFEAYIEKYKPNNWGPGNDCLYAVVAYWYQRAGGSDAYESAPMKDRYVDRLGQSDHSGKAKDGGEDL
ncbi:hypothetical protein COL26b_004423 [Colletotrichum chrysophilum]|uniref:uncharacterized protein n=1 Tax=Colletotrichum chrysophilum TaxID=1836956 RepID=UPI0023001CDF|nr:uncharacterized protein COL26b_004423 [Colletotrichum chrysophilum]KAJ0377234.1 hypothetical protein COL26b_004423 [Colletotrichum chrysophilum]